MAILDLRLQTSAGYLTINNFLFKDTYCPSNWTYFKDHCYKVIHHRHLLSWTDAEHYCNEKHAHLTSIRDREDMEFIHSLIISNLGSSATPPIKVFIGKTFCSVMFNSP